ncbi:MAG: hypothetical protein AB7U81_08865 [Thiohalomonadaceae bacterium]
MRDNSGFFLDTETGAGREQNAVVYTPRRSRNRFQANCVQLVDTEEQALQAADPARHLYAARVVGPSKSSEGFMMFYLVRWLDVAP